MKPIAFLLLVNVLAVALYVFLPERVDADATVDALRDEQTSEQDLTLPNPIASTLDRSVPVDQLESQSAPDIAEQSPAPAVPEAEIAGRVVTSEGAPIGDAQIFITHVDGSRSSLGSIALPPAVQPDAITDANGDFHVPAGESHTTLGTVLAVGHAPRIAILRGPGVDPEIDVVEIALGRSARAEGVVLGAPSGSIVRAVAPAYGLQSAADVDRRLLTFDVAVWSTVGLHGAMALEDLPTGTPLRLELYHTSKGIALLKDPEPVMLAAGVTHRIDWRVDGGGKIACVVRESDGRPAPDIGVWLLAGADGRRGRARWNWKPTRQGRSDADGRVTFVDLLPGKWVVALEPQRTSAGYAAVAVDVTVPENEGEVTVDLTVSRGLYIGGTLFDPDGTPCRGYVSASTPGFAERSPAGADGSFLLGPLMAGEYGLVADSRSNKGRPLANTDRVHAIAGDRGVRLQFNPGANLKLHAVDRATGDPVEAIYASAVVGKRYSMILSGDVSEHRQFDHRPLGVHVAIATTPDGRAGLVEGIVLTAYETRDVEIPVQAGGFVRVRYTGPEPYLQCGVWRSGVAIARDTATSGGDALFTLPPGRMTVELRVYDRTSDERPVPLLFDESRDVVVVAGEEIVIEIRR